MAEKLCTLRKCGGGKMKETVLWTNPDTSVDYPNTSATLSESMDNYDYLKLKFQFNKTTPDTYSIVIYSVDEFSKLTSAGGFIGQVGMLVSSYYYTRIFWRGSSGTQVRINPSYRWNPSTAGATYNNTLIPVSISGLKA